jgi:hypothetical protein
MTDRLRTVSAIDELAEKERRERERAKARAEQLKAIGGVLTVLALAETVVLQTLGIAVLVKVLRR